MEQAITLIRGSIPIIATNIASAVTNTLLMYIKERLHLFLIAAIVSVIIKVVQHYYTQWCQRDGRIDPLEIMGMTIVDMIHMVVSFIAMQLFISLCMGFLLAYVIPIFPIIVICGLGSVVILFSAAPHVIMAVFGSSLNANRTDAKKPIVVRNGLLLNAMELTESMWDDIYLTREVEEWIKVNHHHYYHKDDTDITNDITT